MAVRWVFLAAHDGDRACPGELLELVEAGAVACGAGDLAVEDVPGRVVTVVVLGAATKLVSEVEVVGADGVDEERETRTVGPLGVFGVGPRADIDEQFDTVAADELDEVLGAMV